MSRSSKRRRNMNRTNDRLDEIARSRGHPDKSALEEWVDTSYHDQTKMNYWRTQFGVGHNDVYCGYLRQPITVDDWGEYLSVYGGCVLNEAYCTNTESPQENKCNYCPVYRDYFNIQD